MHCSSGERRQISITIYCSQNFIFIHCKKSIHCTTFAQIADFVKSSYFSNRDILGKIFGLESLLLAFVSFQILYMLAFPIPVACDVISGFSWHKVLNMFSTHLLSPLLIGLPLLCFKTDLSAIMHLLLQNLLLF
jgi:hypothetical protein